MFRINLHLATLLFICTIFKIISSAVNIYLPILNDISSILMVLFLTIYFIKIKCRKQSYIVLILLILNLIAAAILTTKFKILKDGILLFYIILQFLISCEPKYISVLQKALIKYYVPLKKMIAILIIINIIYFITPLGWDISWNEKSFVGYIGKSHDLTYYNILLLSLILSLGKLKNDKKIYVYIIPLMIFSIFSGARTGTIVLAMLVFNILKLNIKNILPIGGITTILTIGIVTNPQLPFVKKFQNTKELNRLDNGRGTFWSSMINDFRESSCINKIVGSGLDRSYIVNQNDSGVYIWAHNDFFNLLVTVGITGVLIYFYSFIKYIFSIKFYNKIQFFIFLGALSLLSMYNGLYNYTNFIIAIPFLKIAFHNNIES